MNLTSSHALFDFFELSSRYAIGSDYQRSSESVNESLLGTEVMLNDFSPGVLLNVFIQTKNYIAKLLGLRTLRCYAAADDESEEEDGRNAPSTTSLRNKS